MNVYNTLALGRFMSEGNRQCVRQALIAYFGNTSSIQKTLHKLLPQLMTNFASRAEKNLLYSQPVDSGDIVSQVRCLNDYFLTDTVNFLDQYYLKCTNRDAQINNSTHTFNDGRVATADTMVRKAARQSLDDRNTGHLKYSMDGGGSPSASADQKLQAMWYPSRGREVRGDIAGDRDCDSPAANWCTDARSYANVATGSGFYYDGLGGPGDSTHKSVESFMSGPTGENTANHINLFMSDPKIQLLNAHSKGKFDDRRYVGGPDLSSPDSDPQYNVKLWADDRGFIDESDPAAMTRYMTRRTFRNWSTNPCVEPDSAEAQIPFWIKNVHHRHVDRVNNNSLDGNVERGCMDRKFDMSSVKCRVAANQSHYREVVDRGIERPDSARVWGRDGGCARPSPPGTRQPPGTRPS